MSGLTCASLVRRDSHCRFHSSASSSNVLICAFIMPEQARQNAHERLVKPGGDAPNVLGGVLGSADSNRCVDSGRLSPIAVDSRRPTRIAASIHVGRLESMRRFTSADLNRCVDSRRPTRIAASIRVGWRQSLSIHVGRLELPGATKRNWPQPFGD